MESAGHPRTFKWRPVEESQADQSTRIEAEPGALYRFRKVDAAQKRGGSPDRDDTYMDHLFDREENDRNDGCSSVESDGTVVDRIQFKASRRAWKKVEHGSDGRFHVNPSVDDSHLTITDGEDVVIKRAPRMSESQNLGSKKSGHPDGQIPYSTPKISGPLELSAPLVLKKSILLPAKGTNRRASLSNENDIPHSNQEIDKVVVNHQTGKKKYLLRPSIEKPSPRLLGNLQINRTTQRSKTSDPHELKSLKPVQTPKISPSHPQRTPSYLSNPFREPEILENLPRVRR